MADETPLDDDSELVSRICAGDREAFVEFTERKRRPLLAFVDRKMSDGLKRKIEPQDIVQEAVAGAVDTFGEIDFSNREPFGWLCHLAERRIIDAHRKLFGAQKRSADREIGLNAPAGDSEDGALIDLLVASMTSPSRAFSRDQREFKMLEAVDELSEDAKAALQMRYVQGLPSKEIAEQLGKTDAAVRVLLTRSLKKLQSTLSQDTLFKSFVPKKDEE